MNKKGRIILCVLLLALAALLIPKSKTVYGISDGGAYRMVTGSEDALAPWIWFEMSGKRIGFTSALDARISSVTNGTVEFGRGRVYAVSENGTQTWIFDVIDNDTLAFIAKGSTIPLDSRGNAIITDGALFKRADR